MNIQDTIGAIENGEFGNAFQALYGQEAAERYTKNLRDYWAVFGDAEDISLYSAPGRTEIGGNHTDHQQGCVLAAALNLDAIAAAAKTDEPTISIQSVGHKLDIVDLRCLVPIEAECGHAAALIRGMCARLTILGYRVGGFNAHTTSQVLGGSGMSSSAAFEVLVGTIISHLYNDGGIDPVVIAQCGQYAENVYFGKPSGLMDQMACSVGGFVGIDFYEKETPKIEPVDFDFAATGHHLCIVDTGGSHADLTDEYAAIMQEMRAVAAFFGQEVLSRVTREQIIGEAAALRAALGDRAVLRALHFTADTRRAVLEKEALGRGDFDGFLRLIRQSGKSSFMYLQNVYAIGSPREQGLSLALLLSDTVLGDCGAYRVHGGGFAGTIQAFVPEDLLETYRTTLEAVFGAGSCHVLHVRAKGGTRVDMA